MVLLLPPIEGLLGHAHLPADFGDRGARLRVPQSQGDLLLRKRLLPHGVLLELRTTIYWEL